MRCPKQTRRSLLLTTLATGAFLTGGRFAAAQEDQPGSSDLSFTLGSASAAGATLAPRSNSIRASLNSLASALVGPKPATPASRP